MKLSLEFQLGLRAAIAVVLAITITHVFHLDRAYWSILTVLLLMSQSWGETISKAWKRFAMTVVGCGVGTILVWLLGGTHWLMFVVIIVCNFFIVFFVPKYYARSMFFVGIFVALLFALIKEWDLHILWMRIYETGLACVIVIITTGLFLPHFARQDFVHAIRNTVGKMQTVFQQTLQPARQKEADRHTFQVLGNMIHNLREQFVQVRYELFFQPRRRRRVSTLLQNLEVALHYLMNLVQLAPQFTKANHDDAALLQCVYERLLQRFEQVQTLMAGQKEVALLPQLSEKVNPMLEQVFSKQPMHGHDDMAMRLSAMLYYSERLDEQLLAMAEVLQNN